MVKRRAIFLLALIIICTNEFSNIYSSAEETAVDGKYSDDDDDDYDFSDDDDDDYDYDNDDDDNDSNNKSGGSEDKLVQDDDITDDDNTTNNGEIDNNAAKSAAQKKIDELQSKCDDLEKKSRAAKKDLNAKISKRQIAERNTQTIASKIDDAISQIRLLEQKQKILEKEISKKEAELKRTQAKKEKEIKFLQNRFRNNYTSEDQNTSALSLLIKGNFFGVLTNNEFQKRINKKDRQIIERLKALESKIEKDSNVLKENKAELDKTKSAIERKKKQLKVEYDISSKQVYDLKLLEKEVREHYQEYIRQEREYQKQISAIFAQIKTMSDKYVGGKFAWPVPGYYTIYSGFGYRDLGGYHDYHGGIDIAGGGIYGKNVIAANAGKVVYVSYSNSKRYGSYGHHVIIDHGGNICTLYGHLSSICVSQGQMVAKGQKIGEVGATGFVTGAHLHFEVRENGKRVNPVPYLSKKE